jgi:hypothetical protein
VSEQLLWHVDSAYSAALMVKKNIRGRGREMTHYFFVHVTCVRVLIFDVFGPVEERIFLFRSGCRDVMVSFSGFAQNKDTVRF